MTDQEEKLVELLKETGMLEIEDCLYIAEHLIENGVTVKEAQKPLTLEELSYEAEMYWVENEDGCFPVLLWDKAYCFTSFSQFGTELDVVLNNDGYGKIGRCWAEMPTEAERKAAEWEM